MTIRKKALRGCSPPQGKDPWRDKPDIVRRFIENRDDYERLCDEVKYILTKRIKENDIEISTVTARAKTLNSFLEKIQRKTYDEPFSEITDLAGVRVVCLYIRDIPEIENIIRGEFEVIEKVDKLTDKQPDQFGYGATHFVVRLGKSMSGARYEDLRHLVCELQVRTVLQDSWAIIDHHLVYKKESAVPKAIQRKLNSLAGLFETADDQFEQIRQQRLEYVSEMRDSSGSEESFLAHEVNTDSLTEFLAWRFPNQSLEAFDGQFEMVQEDIDFGKYKSLKEIDDIVRATSTARSVVLDKLGGTPQKNAAHSAAVELAIALCLSDSDFLSGARLPKEWRDIVDEARKSEAT